MLTATPTLASAGPSTLTDAGHSAALTRMDAEPERSGCDERALRKAVSALAGCIAKPEEARVTTLADPRYGLWYLRQESSKLVLDGACANSPDDGVGSRDCCRDKGFRASSETLAAFSAHSSSNPDIPDDPHYDGTEVASRWGAYFTRRSGTWFRRYLDYLARELSSAPTDSPALPGPRLALQHAQCGLVAASGKSLSVLLGRQVGTEVKLLAVVDEPATHLWQATNRPVESCGASAMRSLIASLVRALASPKTGALDEVADPEHGITFFVTRGAFEKPLCSYAMRTGRGKGCSTRTLQKMRKVLAMNLSNTAVDEPVRELPREALDRAGRWGSYYTTLDAAGGVMRDTRWLLFDAANNLPEPQDKNVGAAMRTGDCGFVSEHNWKFVRVLMRKANVGLRVVGILLGEQYAGTDMSREGGR